MYSVIWSTINFMPNSYRVLILQSFLFLFIITLKQNPAIYSNKLHEVLYRYSYYVVNNREILQRSSRTEPPIFTWERVWMRPTRPLAGDETWRSNRISNQHKSRHWRPETHLGPWEHCYAKIVWLPACQCHHHFAGMILGKYPGSGVIQTYFTIALFILRIIIIGYLHPYISLASIYLDDSR